MERYISPLRGAWRFRYFIAGSIGKEFRARFAHSRLGAVWSILNPLALVAIYALVLSTVLSARLPGLEGRFSFAVYLTAGIFAWTLFSDILTRSTGLFVENANVLKKVVFPRISLPLVVAGTALIDNLFLFLAIVGILGLVGHWPGAQVVWLPVLVLINVGLALGLGLILGTLNVFIRDISHVVPIALQFGFWLTPIVYAADMVPPALRMVLSLSPLFPLVTAYQDVLVFNRAPSILSLLALIGLVALLLSLALALFRRASGEMVDVL
jgi:lipopolysaccharide transport system permease protein